MANAPSSPACVLLDQGYASGYNGLTAKQRAICCFGCIKQVLDWEDVSAAAAITNLCGSAIARASIALYTESTQRSFAR